MKKILIFIILTMATLTVHSTEFEIYGLKSGITKTEFYELTKCQEFIDTYNAKKTPSTYSPAKGLSYCLQAPYNSLNTGEYAYANLPFFGIEPTVSLKWTHDERLWRVSLNYEKPKGILEGIAYQRAVQEAHPGMDIVESTVNGQYSNKDYLTVNYIDGPLSDSSIEHQFGLYSAKINDKK